VVLIAGENSIGTGVLISSSGDIVTNEHVVRDAHKERGAEWEAVWFKPSGNAKPDKDKFLLARVVRKLESRDLALIRLIQPPPPSALVLPIASGLPDVGQEVFVIGHPKAYLWSLTQGIVSQIRPDHAWQYDEGIPRVATAIQTQAPINPGNSGGPLLNDDGSVLGIVVGGAQEAQGLFFAVAAEHLRELATR
jgi:S1-C subfamily serine protease